MLPESTRKSRPCLSALQLRQESRQIPEFSDRLKLPLLVKIENAYAINGDVFPGRCRQTEFPIDCHLMAAHDDLLDVVLDLTERGDNGRDIGAIACVPCRGGVPTGSSSTPSGAKLFT